MLLICTSPRLFWLTQRNQSARNGFVEDARQGSNVDDED
jgi:hypothetical protein